MAWHIRNVSDKPIGVHAPFRRDAQTRLVALDFTQLWIADDLKRSLASTLADTGHVSSSTLLLASSFTVASISPDGKVDRSASSSGIHIPITLIEPGGYLTAVCSVRVDPDASQTKETAQSIQADMQNHGQACLTAYLDLGHPQSLLSMHPIQVRPFQVQLAESFDFCRFETKILLVANNRTTSAEVSAWRSLVNGLLGEPTKNTVAVWNVSLYSGFSFKYKVPVLVSNTEKDRTISFGELFGGDNCSVIFLNNLCTPTAVRTGTREDFPIQFLQHEELLHACKDHGCRIYIAGSRTGVNLHSRIRVPVDAVNKHELESEDALFKDAVSIMYPGHARIEDGEDEKRKGGDPQQSMAAWLTSDLKGPLYKQKQCGHGKVKRIFALRKAQGQLLYFSKQNSPKPSAEFRLADCSLITETHADQSSEQGGKSHQERLTIKTPTRMLVLMPVTGKKPGPSLSQWRRAMEDAIDFARSANGQRTASASNTASAISWDFDITRPKGFDTYCSTNVIIRQMSVREASLQKRAEALSKKLSMTYPEYQFLVVYRYVEKKDQEANNGIMFNKRNIGDITVHIGVPRGSGTIVTDLQAAGSSADGGAFVHTQVLSDKNKYAYLKSLSMAMKMRLLRESGNDGSLGSLWKHAASCSLHMLVDAIMSDVADENAAFRFGDVSAAAKVKQAVLGTKKRSEAESWAARMICLSTIGAEESIGVVQVGSVKCQEVFRLCVMLRLLIKSSVPVAQKTFKVSRAGTIARAAAVTLDKLENNFVSALGLEKASLLVNEDGRTISKCVDALFKRGLPAGDDKAVSPLDLLSFFRCRYGVGVEGADSEGGLYRPIVINQQEFTKAKDAAQLISMPRICRRPGMFQSDSERQRAVAAFLSCYKPAQE